MSPYAVLFPGQGSQFVGMGSELFDTRSDLLGDPADRILGWGLRRVCLEGPEEELTRTDRAQPALYALSYALWDTLRPLLPGPPAGAAGHSVGEYTALAAAGMVDYPTGLRLVSARGSAMSEAARLEPSGMVALLGAGSELAEEVAAARRADGGRLWVANLNAPGQVVVAGGSEDVAWLVGAARELGIRRAVPLKVAGAFHSPLMAPAVDDLRRALAEIPWSQPAFPVWSNVTAAPVGAQEASDLLLEQLTSPVRFSESLEGLGSQGVEVFVHVGPGDVTAGLVRRTVPGAEVLVVSDPGGAEEAARRLEAAIE